MPNNAFEIRQLLGFLGVSAGTSGGMVAGERQTFSTLLSNTVPLGGSKAGLFFGPSVGIPLRPTDALVIEAFSGGIQPTDVSGKLKIEGMSAHILDSTGAGVICAVMNVIGPAIGTLLPISASNQGIGFWVEPPPALRPRDLRNLAAGTDGTPSVSPYTLVFEVDVVNTDGAAPHSFNLYGTAWWRVISGVTP